jgi:hypothetical protein
MLALACVPREPTVIRLRRLSIERLALRFPRFRLMHGGD